MSEEKRPKVNSAAQKELDKAQENFEKFDQEIKDLTLDRMNTAPKQEVEQQTKMSTKEMQNSKDVYLKPIRSISSKEKFNENFRAAYEFEKEYVQFVAENREIVGEKIELWTKKFPGVPAEFWEVPVNKPVWGPRYLAERIHGCTYNRLVMQENKVVGADGMGQYIGSMVVDETRHRLDAYPVSQRRSLFMGA